MGIPTYLSPGPVNWFKFLRGRGNARFLDFHRAASRRLGAPEPSIPRALRSRSARSNGAGSNAQCNQHNNTDPDNQHRKRNGIIIEPVAVLYTHDATSIPKAEDAIAAAPWAAFRGSA